MNQCNIVIILSPPRHYQFRGQLWEGASWLAEDNTNNLRQPPSGCICHEPAGCRHSRALGGGHSAPNTRAPRGSHEDKRSQ